MYSKNIFIFLILGLITLTKIYGRVDTGECKDIYEYLDGQGRAKNLYDCEVNNKGEVIELQLYASCLDNEQLKTVLSYKTIKTLNFETSKPLWNAELGCDFYPTNYEIFNTLTSLKSLSLTGPTMDFFINIISVIPKSLEILQIEDEEDFSNNLQVTQKFVDALSKLSNLNSLICIRIGFSEKIDYSKFRNLKKFTSLEVEYSSREIDYIQVNLLKYCNYLKKLIIRTAKFNENSFNAISNLTNLEELEIEYFNYEDTAIFTSINKLKDLTSLTLICGVDYDFIRHDFSSNLFYLTKLKSLSITNCAITFFPPLNNSLSWSNLKNLEYLSIKTSDDEYRDDVFDYKYLGDVPSLKEVYIIGKGYSNITDNIGNLKNLEILDLSYNSIVSLPKGISGLKNLRELDLHSNDLISIPEEIGNLKNLRELRISFNELTSLPESIGNLVNLNILYIPYNKIINIPESIGNLSNLERLTLNNNQISEIPKSIGNLTITELNLENNNIEKIPDEIGNIKNLEELNLKNNTIINIPSSLGNLENLNTLDLFSNSIDDYLPESLNNLPNLYRINLGNNINIKGKTLTNPSLKECNYDSNYSLCISTNTTCPIRNNLLPCEE